MQTGGRQPRWVRTPTRHNKESFEEIYNVHSYNHNAFDYGRIDNWVVVISTSAGQEREIKPGHYRAQDRSSRPPTVAV